MEQITALDVRDIRFPTSSQADGSDAMHPDPDYSAAYVVVHTDGTHGHEGHGFAFTIGRGNEVQTAAIWALAPPPRPRPSRPPSTPTPVWVAYALLAWCVPWLALAEVSRAFARPMAMRRTRVR